MSGKNDRTWAEIDMAALEHNYREIKAALPDNCRVAGLCKANAYGHGAVPVARRLEELGAGYLAVSCFEEAHELRAAGISMPILTLAPSLPDLAPELAAIGAEQAVGDARTARAMDRALEGTRLRLRCHVKLETGMGRTGYSVHSPDFMSDMRELLSLRNLKVEGVFTHFAVSDDPEGEEYTRAQYAAFIAAADAVESETGVCLGMRHCANSGAVVNYREMALDMARPGLLLYGLYPCEARGGLDLRPVMSLKTRICQLTRHKKGDTISYGRIFTCPRDMTLAVIPVGYADGLHRSLSGRMQVLVGDRRAQQVGRICMDMCMVDVTDLEGVSVGDTVTVFGASPTADEQAKIAGTIPYELLCAVSPRVPRVYLG